ncbi:hypothetical protein RHMOL_Rhmol09G0151700 [Rhododendron molle]|uniref:Uncharacterized protein n=1 Tax=Rhododendron molle TaxID=49168 RepID=A0ACC0ME75_RHOML|nr:hypothetical protein RHMOL_Rhmol09G0151700 [Rhododendron molle]
MVEGPTLPIDQPHPSRLIPSISLTSLAESPPIFITSGTHLAVDHHHYEEVRKADVVLSIVSQTELENPVLTVLDLELCLSRFSSLSVAAVSAGGLFWLLFQLLNLERLRENLFMYSLEGEELFYCSFWAWSSFVFRLRASEFGN